MDIQQALLDFDATIKAKPELTDEELFQKFPEFDNDSTKLAAARDYSATLNSDKYKGPEEFNHKFPEFFDVKKKDGGNSTDPSQSVSASQSGNQETDPIFGLLRQRQKLQADKKAAQAVTSVGGPLATPVSTNDIVSGYDKSISSIDEEIKKKGYNVTELEKLFGKVSNLDLSDDELKSIYDLGKSNPFTFGRKVAAINWQGQLYDAILAKYKKELPDASARAAATSEINNIIALNTDNSYDQNKRNAAAIKQKIYDYTAGNADLRKEILGQFGVDRAYGYGIDYNDKDSVLQNDTRAGKLNKFQILGMDYLQNVDDERFYSRNKMMNVTDEERNKNIDNVDFNLGLQTINKEAEDTGLKLVEKAALERLTRIAPKAEKNELNEGEKIAYNKSLQNLKEVNEYRQSQRSRYPMAITAEVDSIIQEATSPYKNMAERFMLQTGEQVDNAVTFIKDLITSPFMGDAAKNARDIEQLGDKRVVQSSLIYTPGNESIVERDFNIGFSKKLQDKIDEINASKLSDEEKIQAKRNATLENFDEVQISANPNAGKVNLTVKTVLGATSAVASQMIPQIAIALGTGGAGNISKVRSLATLFGSTFATAYQPYYAEALATGAANPTEYALKRTFIEASTELIGDDLERVKKLFKGSGIAGDIAGSITEAEWKAFTRQGSAFQKLKDKFIQPLAEGVVKPAVQEGAEEVLSQVGTNYLDDEDLSKGVKESFVTTAVGMVGMQLAGLPFSYKNITRNQKYTLFEAGSNPAQYMNAIDEQLKNGDINAEEAQRRKSVIKTMGGIVNNMMTQRQDGKPLTDNEKVDYAFNEFVKQQSQTAAKNAPSGTAARMNETATKVDAENDAILSNTKDESLSAKPLSKIESAQASDFTAAPVSEGYAERMQAAKDSLGSNGISVDVYNQEDYDKIAEEGGQFITNQDGTAMGVLKPNGEMVSLVKSSENKQKNVAPAMLEKMKQLGGLFMDNFDIYLTKQYEKAGFRVVARLPFNEEYAPQGWQESPLKDKPDVVFMAREDIAPAEEKQFTDYDEAKAYTEGLVKQAVAEGKAKLPTTVTAEFADKTISEANKNQPMIEKLQQALQATGIQVEEVDDLEATVGQQGLGGVFIAEDGKILLDKKSLSKKGDAARIIYHEGAHPVMNIIRNTNKELYDAVVAGVKEAAKQNRAIARAVAWAEKNYNKEGQEVVNDEAVVEVISMIADGTIDMANIPDSWKQKVVDFINQIAKVFGLPQVDPTNLAQFKATAAKVAEALTTGKDVSDIVGKENVGEYQNEIPSILAAGEMQNPAQARIMGEPLDIYEGKEVKNLPVKTLSEIFKKFGGRATVINSDPTRVGELTLPSGKKIFMYGGPAYLALKENADSNIGFATTQPSKVNSWAKYVKEIFGNDNGVTLIGTQAPTSMMANSYALRYVLDAISTLPKTILKSKEFKDEFFGKDLVLLKDAFGEKGYNDFVNKYKKADLSDPATIDGMIAEMAYKVGDDNQPASFKARGAFVSNLLGGIALKSEIKSVEGDKGYVSKKPTKFIAKQLFDRLGLNQEKLFYELGEKSLVDLYMNEGKWGMAVAGFETDPSLSVDQVQSGGVKHPLFNAKFPGKNAFLLDGAYDLDQLFTPQEIIANSGNPYMKKASQMLAGSMYVKGDQQETEKVFKYNEAAPVGNKIQGRVNEELLAPNGKPSNLNAKQYEQVRTPEFKAWFGDWENDPENASKVLDENGEPLVVYHGSVANDIEVFDRGLSKRKSSGLREMGYYFTTNRSLADLYSKAPVRDGVENTGSKVYEAFLNLRKVKEFDAEGKGGIRAWDKLQVDAGYKIAQNRDAMDFLMNGKFGVEKVDGIIAYNIADMESYGAQTVNEKFNGTVYLVFDDNKNAIKSATDNSGAFSKTDNRIQARKFDDLVEAAGLTKQMVQDDQGNYVFYHFSGKKLKSIDPNKFGSNTRATGRDERPGVGISMYYTRPDNREANVPNDYGYAVRIPKEQVYPFNSDPLGLLDEAEAQFKAQYPDQAFDPNKQVGFVTKVAAEKGFPMTVAKWDGKLRAQSTEALTPEYYSKIVPGTLNQVEVNPKLAKFKPGKTYQARVEDNQEEKDRGFAKTYDQRDLKVIGQISQDAKTYFAISNKQTAEEVKAFMENKNPEDVLDYLLQQPQDIPGRVRIWMSGVVMDEIDQAIVAAYESGDKETEARLITKQANLIDQIAPLGTELGQAIQAFRRFYQNSKGSPAMFNHFFNNLVSKIESEANRQLTEEEKADIKEIAQKLQDAPEGLPKDEAAYELGNYVGKITPVSAVDIFQAIWYAHILSGVTTQATNFFANFWNTFAEGVVTGIRESVKSRSLMPFIMGLKGFTDGVRLGATEGLDIFLTGLSKQDADKFKNKDLLEYFDWRQSKVGKLLGGKVGKILNFAGSWSPAVLKYVGRALAATDAAFARSNTEAISRMMAYTQATKEGAKDKMTRVREILYNTKENIQNATQQAEDEGFVKGTRRFTRRVYEIMEQQRGDEFNQKAEDYGKKVTLNYEPEGFTRPLYNAAVALQNSSKMAKLFIPFTRIIANLTENSLNYTPLGYIKTITGKTRSEGGFRRLTKDERADFAIKATIGVATFMALAAMTGDDDDDIFDITANGTGDIAKNYELRKGGWRPYSIKLKSGRYVSYKDWPIMPLLAALGSMHDADKYQKEEPSNEAIVAMWGMANAVYDKSVMKGIQDFVEIFKPSQEYNQNSNFGDRLVSWGSDQASTMLVSNFTKQNIKFVQEAMDSPVKAAKGVERIYRDIPYLNDGLNPIIDVFGDTITQTTSEKLLPFTIKRPKSDYIIKTLNENGVFIGKPQTRDIIVDEDTGESRPMTDQEYYNYAKRAGQLTKEYMIEYWDDFKEILEIKDQKERVTSLQKATNKIVSAARLQAMDLFYED